MEVMIMLWLCKYYSQYQVQEEKALALKLANYDVVCLYKNAEAESLSLM